MMLEVRSNRKYDQNMQSIFAHVLSKEQSLILVEKKLMYPLPRHFFSCVEWSSNRNTIENIGIRKFNIDKILPNS